MIGPKGNILHVPKGKHWVYSKENLSKLISENRIWFGNNGLSFPRKKRFLSEVQQGRKPGTIWFSKDVGHNQEATREIKEILGESVFNNPKPTRLIKQIISLVTASGDLILDSFAGSGTTAHAVLDLNKEDGGNRKFILVEMEDYADNITAERVRRVIKSGIPGTFSYFDLGDAIEMQTLLSGTNLPSYNDLARYVFYTATGEEFEENHINENEHYIGSSKNYEIYLIYKPDLEYLKSNPLTLDKAKKLVSKSGKRKLVFAPTKFIDQDNLDKLKIDFAQLPFEIYKLIKQ